MRGPATIKHKQTLRTHQYFALLAVADGCLVTSQRDGMNLTAHEFVACQQEKHSPLILSEFTGTYGSLGGALRINPWDMQVQLNAFTAWLAGAVGRERL